MNTTQRNNLIRAALRAAYPGTSFEAQALSGKSGRQGYRNLALAWTGGPGVGEVKALVEGLDGCFWGLRAGYSRTMTPDERDAWLAGYHAAEPARQAEAVAAKAARAEAGRAKRVETTTRKAALGSALAAAFPGTAFTLAAARHGLLEVSYAGGPAVDAVKQVAARCHVVRRSTAEERAAAIKAQERATRECEAIRSRLEALGAQPMPCASLAQLRSQIASLRREKARLKRATAMTGVRFRRPAAPRRLGPQPLLPLALPFSFARFAAPRAACRSGAEVRQQGTCERG